MWGGWMSLFPANELTITVKDGKTELIINGEQVPCRSVKFQAAFDELPTISFETFIFPPDKKRMKEIVDEQGRPTGSFVEVSE